MPGARDRGRLALGAYGPLAIVLVIGLGIRLWAMRFPPFPIDMQDWIAWGERLLAVGPARFYDPNVFADYAPGYLYVTWLTAAIKNGLLPEAGRGTYYALYRLPPIMFDLATGWLIYKIVQPFFARRSVPTLAAACHVFNPAIMINSAVWGQIDGVFTFFILLSLALLLRGRAEWAVVSYVIAFMIKPQSISLAPLIGIVLLLRFPPRRWLTSGAVGISLGFSLLLPFFGLRSFLGLIEVLQGSVETYPYTSLFTYNIWGIYGMWRDDRELGFFGLPLRSLGTLLYGVGLVYGIPVFVQQFRRSNTDTPTIFLFATYFTLLPVMVLTRMHERYLYPALPLLLIFAFVQMARRDRSALDMLRSVPFWLFVALAILHTLNLYQVYTYYPFRLQEVPVPREYRFYYFIDDRPKLWSALTLFMFAVIALALPWWTGRSRSERASMT